jgi:hypothetical protein
MNDNRMTAEEHAKRDRERWNAGKDPKAWAERFDDLIVQYWTQKHSTDVLQHRLNELLDALRPFWLFWKGVRTMSDLDKRDSVVRIDNQSLSNHAFERLFQAIGSEMPVEMTMDEEVE